MQKSNFGCVKSIAGVALLGLGIFVLYANLDHLATQLCHPQGACGATGVLPNLILAAWRVWRAYAADRQRFLHDFLRHMLVSSWPLLLVIIGTVLSRDSFTESVIAPDDDAVPEKKNREFVDLSARRSTSK